MLIPQELQLSRHTTYDAIKVGVVHIGVGLCVVVLLIWAMREPQCVEQQRAGFPRFFVCARNYVV